MHTDWLSYARSILHFSTQNIDRVRRLLRFLYHCYDRIFVFNEEQKKWLGGPDMDIPSEQIFLTSSFQNATMEREKNDVPSIIIDNLLETV